MAPRVGCGWGVAECAALRSAVHDCGRRWTAVAGRLKGRTATAVRLQWGKMSREVCVAEAANLGSAALEQVVAPVDMVGLPLVAESRGGTLHRTVSGGRPWSYAVQLTRQCGGRKPTVRQLKLIYNWALHEGGLLLCNFKGAEAKVVRHLKTRGVDARGMRAALWTTTFTAAERDALGLVVHTGGAGVTLTSSGSAYNWIGGEHIQSGRFVLPHETAQFMGISTRGGCFSAAMRLVKSEVRVHALLAESLQSRMADRMVAIGREVCLVPCASVGSLYSGAFDELAEACVRSYGTLRREFVSETDELKRHILIEGAVPVRAFKDVMLMCGLVDILVVTPPCLMFSTANRVRNRAGGRDRDARGEACSAAEEHMIAVGAAVRNTQPKLVLVEAAGDRVEDSLW